METAEAPVITKPPSEPRTAREERKAAYVKVTKDQSRGENITLPLPLPQASEPLITQEIQSRGLPSGFKEVRMSELSLSLASSDLPWLGQASLQRPLAEITLAGNDGQKFLYGSAILGKDLVGAADQLDKHRSGITNNLFYSHLPEFIKSGTHPYIKMVHDASTERPIYNIYNKGGQRVYFMRFDKLQGMPVILRVAVCDKDRQAQVLGVLTTQSYKAIKQSARL